MNLFIHSIPNWMELAFLALSIGILTSLLWVVPAQDGPPGHENLRSRMWLFFSISVVSILACAALDLMMRAVEMSGVPSAEVISVLPTVVFHTHYGSVWLIRTIALVFVIILLPAGKKIRNSSVFLAFLLVLTAIVCLTESASGHAADAGDFSLIEVTDWLHLLAASVWGGGLFALTLMILPFFSKSGGRESRFLADAASRFSRIAGFAVVIIVLSAPYNAWTYVGTIDALVKSGYGRTIIAKIILLIFLIYMGAVNRYVRIPVMRRAALLPEERKGVVGGLLAPALAFHANNPGGRNARGFARSVTAEAVLMIGVLLCAAMLRHEVPAKHYLHQQGGYHQHPRH